MAMVDLAECRLAHSPHLRQGTDHSGTARITSACWCVAPDATRCGQLTGLGSVIFIFNVVDGSVVAIICPLLLLFYIVFNAFVVVGVCPLLKMLFLVTGALYRTADCY